MADADHARQRPRLSGRVALRMIPKSGRRFRKDIMPNKRTTSTFWLAGLIAAALVPLFLPVAPFARDGIDWITKFPRTDIHIAAWPGGKKVAVSFALFVEEFGFGQGPVYRPDLASRTPDLVNENFRVYAQGWGNLRVGHLFKEIDVPLTVVLNAEFPRAHSSEWKEFRAAQPDAPIIAHGMNNTNHMLPLSRGLDEQTVYIRDTLNLIASTTGVKSTGWSSPSVYANADTMQAMAAAGITYTLDGMDFDIVSRLNTPDGPLILLPYPVVTVDMGQNLTRMKSPPEIAALWLDYVLELAEEARADPSREATAVVIGIHPFVVGTPDGAAAMRRVLMRLKTDPSVWLTDTASILKAADVK